MKEDKESVSDFKKKSISGRFEPATPAYSRENLECCPLTEREREEERERGRERLKVLFIEKHGRGLNRVPVCTGIFARLY